MYRIKVLQSGKPTDVEVENSDAFVAIHDAVHQIRMRIDQTVAANLLLQASQWLKDYFEAKPTGMQDEELAEIGYDRDGIQLTLLISRYKPDILTNCPICGEELQATAEVWYSGTTITPSGTLLDLGTSDEDQINYDGARVYCRNDCTLEDMLEFINGDETTRNNIRDNRCNEEE